MVIETDNADGHLADDLRCRVDRNRSVGKRVTSKKGLYRFLGQLDMDRRRLIIDFNGDAKIRSLALQIRGGRSFRHSRELIVTIVVSVDNIVLACRSERRRVGGVLQL